MTSTLKGFDVTDFEYESKEAGILIPASLLAPKQLQPGKHAVIIRWHGGCFITGHRLFPRWYGSWTLELALTKSAIVLAPDYRLLPEACGPDILQDVKGFYSWLATKGGRHLATLLPAGIQLDLQHLLVFGESAGGWMAVQSAFLPESRASVAAVVARYPMLDLRDTHYCEAYEKTIFHPPALPLSRDIADKHVAEIEGRPVVTSAFPPERTPLVVSAMQHGLLGQWLGEDSSLYPIDLLDTEKIDTPIWILHGLEDNVVPIEGTYRFVHKLRTTSPANKIHLTYEPGMHGFDNEANATLDTEWVRSGLTFIGDFWPRV
ncbi:Alpha/Beta hydrolase protein [Neohortaea acidophila]|uniref:Alpha/Beta hydrolase protein n=1 Tax=Neohortaea acidophila TaxID=245834 RepID=A0A6A6PZQ9_9PEZI|nr:Alpha/Beta hydrolase protein [Neohortaea acidophila]KAF2484923.1 Alpha/Beta hydrolase protein [Neohortaea acidophila]